MKTTKRNSFYKTGTILIAAFLILFCFASCNRNSSSAEDYESSEAAIAEDQAEMINAIQEAIKEGEKNQAEDALTITDEGKGWNKASNKTYSILFPDTWECDSSKSVDGKMVIVSPVEEGDLVKENVNILTEAVPYGMNMDGYIEATISNLAVYENLKMLENKRLKSKSGNCHKLVYKGDLFGSQFLFVQGFWIKDKVAYIVTFTTNEDAYVKFKPIAIKMLDSFTFN